MKRIFKYPLRDWEGRQEIRMPAGAEVLSVQKQGRASPTLWALVDDCVAETTSRFFYVAYTGVGFDGSNKKFIGTIVLDPLVLHIYEDHLS